MENQRHTRYTVNYLVDRKNRRQLLMNRTKTLYDALMHRIHNFSLIPRSTKQNEYLL